MELYNSLRHTCRDIWNCIENVIHHDLVLDKDTYRHMVERWNIKSLTITDASFGEMNLRDPTLLTYLKVMCPLEDDVFLRILDCVPNLNSLVLTCFPMEQNGIMQVLPVETPVGMLNLTQLYINFPGSFSFIIKLGFELTFHDTVYENIKRLLDYTLPHLKTFSLHWQAGGSVGRSKKFRKQLLKFLIKNEAIQDFRIFVVPTNYENFSLWIERDSNSSEAEEEEIRTVLKKVQFLLLERDMPKWINILERQEQNTLESIEFAVVYLAIEPLFFKQLVKPIILNHRLSLRKIGFGGFGFTENPGSESLDLCLFEDVPNLEVLEMNAFDLTIRSHRAARGVSPSLQYSCPTIVNLCRLPVSLKRLCLRDCTFFTEDLANFANRMVNLQLIYIFKGESTELNNMDPRFGVNESVFQLFRQLPNIAYIQLEGIYRWPQLGEASLNM